MSSSHALHASHSKEAVASLLAAYTCSLRELLNYARSSFVTRVFLAAFVAMNFVLPLLFIHTEVARTVLGFSLAIYGLTHTWHAMLGPSPAMIAPCVIYGWMLGVSLAPTRLTFLHVDHRSALLLPGLWLPRVFATWLYFTLMMDFAAMMAAVRVIAGMVREARITESLLGVSLGVPVKSSLPMKELAIAVDVKLVKTVAKVEGEDEAREVLAQSDFTESTVSEAKASHALGGAQEFPMQINLENKSGDKKAAPLVTPTPASSPVQKGERERERAAKESHALTTHITPEKSLTKPTTNTPSQGPQPQAQHQHHRHHQQQ